MASDGDFWTGELVLRLEGTDKVMMIALAIHIDDEQVTHTVQSIDRTEIETISAPRESCPFYLRAMGANSRVGQAAK